MNLVPEPEGVCTAVTRDTDYIPMHTGSSGCISGVGKTSLTSIMTLYDGQINNLLIYVRAIHP